MKRRHRTQSLVQSLSVDEPERAATEGIENASMGSLSARGEERSLPFPSDLLDKRYLRIGEVAELLGVKPHVLRYWETEFKQLRPTKSRHGQRLYRRQDVELLLIIQDLLRGERYTIAGARERLDELAGEGKTASSALEMNNWFGDQRLKRITEELKDLISFLDRREMDLRAKRVKIDR